MKTAKSTSIYAIVAFSLLLLRIIPHIANCVPIFGLLVVLIQYYKIPKQVVGIVCGIAVFSADLVLHYLYGYPILGTFSIFTYSGYFILISMASYHNNSVKMLLYSTTNNTVLFWIWTNLGVWLLDNMYSLDSVGFYQCYTMAIPFLKTSLLANIIGIAAFITVIELRLRSSLRSLNTCKSNCINNIIY